MDSQTFNFRLGHIALHLGIPDDGDRTYINNVQLEYLFTEFMSREELDDTGNYSYKPHERSRPYQDDTCILVSDWKPSFSHHG